MCGSIVERRAFAFAESRSYFFGLLADCAPKNAA